MKPTSKQSEEVSSWFFNKFWPNYPAKFTGRGKGSRAISCKLMVAINPDESERERILGNLKAQVLAHAKKPEEFRSFWKIGETYVRNQLWDDEIESSMDIKAAIDLKICTTEGCNNDVHGSAYQFCATHIPSAHSAAMKQAWTRIGIDIKSPNLREDCRAYCRERMGILLNKTT